MYDLTVEDVLYIHSRILEVSGGLGGVRDHGQLEACIARPRQSAFGKEIFVSLFDKAAALLDCLANTHPFVDGNKRTAMAVAVLFLQTHNIHTEFTNQEYEDFMLMVVKDKPKIATIKRWLEQHSTS